MANDAQSVQQIQQQIKTQYSGRYTALCRRLGAGWYKQRLSRVLNSKNPGVIEFLAVCAAAGVSLAPFVQQLR